MLFLFLSVIKLETHQSPASQGQMRVEIDAVALLKIIEHCSSFRDACVSGQLVGFEADDESIEIANSFPNPHSDHQSSSNADSHESSSPSTIAQDYEMNMLKYLRSCQIDHGIVGWYMNSPFPLSFFTQSWMETQISFQKSIEKSIFIAYDPVAAALSSTTSPLIQSAIKAFRLSEAFIASLKTKSFTSISLESILIPVELEVKKSSLAFSPSLKPFTCNPACISIKQQSAPLGRQLGGGNAVLLVARLAERLNELVEKVNFEQERLKKKRKPDDHSSSLIPELLFNQALLLCYSRYLKELFPCEDDSH